MSRCQITGLETWDGKDLRQEFLSLSVLLITMVSGECSDGGGALRAMQQETLEQVPLQDYFPSKVKTEPS